MKNILYVTFVFLIFNVVCYSGYGQENEILVQRAIVINGKGKTKIIKENKKIWITKKDSSSSYGKYTILNDSTIQINSQIITISDIVEIRFRDAKKRAIAGAAGMFGGVQVAYGVLALNANKGGSNLISELSKVFQGARIVASSVVIGVASYFVVSKNTYDLQDCYSLSIRM